MKIVAISGRKQAGKNTAANVLHGVVMQKYGLVQNWAINELGALKVLTHDVANNLAWGEIDISRKDKDFVDYADESLWPFVKLYSFADSLKWMCTDLFKIPYESVWGTDEQKNQLQEHLLWENMPGVITCPELWDHMHPDGESEYGLTYHTTGPMTSREFMQFLGTEIGRKMYEPIWVESTIKRIKNEQPELAIIADCRFPNEAKAIEDAGGYVVRLTRQPFAEDIHPSETALDDFSFKYCIDNQDTELNDFIVRTREFYNDHLSDAVVRKVWHPQQNHGLPDSNIGRNIDCNVHS